MKSKLINTKKNICIINMSCDRLMDILNFAYIERNQFLFQSLPPVFLFGFSDLYTKEVCATVFIDRWTDLISYVIN